MTAITFPVNIPDHADIEQYTDKSTAFVAAAMSPFTGVQNTQRYPGQLLIADVKVSMMGRASARKWISFLRSLNGREGTFLMGDPDGMRPQGSAATVPGNPIVSGAAQSGDVLVIGSATMLASKYLIAGDWIQLGTGAGTHLHMVTQDVAITSAGIGSLALFPRLRESPGNGDPVFVNSCVGIWRMQGNDAPWTEQPTIYSDINFIAVEALGQ